MTILFFTRYFYPHIGGVETHVLEIAKRLSQENNRVIIVTEELPDEDINLEKQPTIKSLEIHRIPVGKDDRFKKFRIWKWLWRNTRLIKSVDIIHCHDVFFWYLPFRFLFFNKKVYTTFHGYETKFPVSKKAIFIRKVSEKLSNGNICAGQYIQKWYGTKSTYVTYGGTNKVQSSKFRVQNLRKKLKILFVGRLEKDNGMQIYLEALTRLQQMGIKYEFTVVGDGSLKKEAEKFGKVEGFLEDVEPFLQEADIVFASSYLSMLQSLIHKKLVVAVYDNPLKKDYLLDSPFARFVLTGNNGSDISGELVRTLKNNTELQKMCDEGFAWAQKQTWEKVVDIYLELWNKKQFF